MILIMNRLNAIYIIDCSDMQQMQASYKNCFRIMEADKVELEWSNDREVNYSLARFRKSLEAIPE